MSTSLCDIPQHPSKSYLKCVISISTHVTLQFQHSVILGLKKKKSNNNYFKIPGSDIKIKHFAHVAAVAVESLWHGLS